MLEMEVVTELGMVWIVMGGGGGAVVTSVDRLWWWHPMVKLEATTREL
jgi:hypothetical protein